MSQLEFEHVEIVGDCGGNFGGRPGFGHWCAKYAACAGVSPGSRTCNSGQFWPRRPEPIAYCSYSLLYIISMCTDVLTRKGRAELLIAILFALNNQVAVSLLFRVAVSLCTQKYAECKRPVESGRSVDTIENRSRQAGCDAAMPCSSPRRSSASRVGAQSPRMPKGSSLSGERRLSD